MDQWLDSLSEDWVSQPRSPHSSSILQGSILRDSPSPGANGSQSRIPRYKPRSVSGLSSTSGNDTGSLRFSRKNGQVDNALREKTSSNINASHKSKGQIKPQDPNAPPNRDRMRQASTSSLPGLAQGTVQHKTSPMKKRGHEGTLDWKKRVLKENAGGDLFSPTGLESVFKPPTVKANPRATPTRKSAQPIAEELPSSPRGNALPNTGIKKLKVNLQEQGIASSPPPGSPTDANAAKDFVLDNKELKLPADSQKEKKTPKFDQEISSTPVGSPESRNCDEQGLPRHDVRHSSSTCNGLKAIPEELENSSVLSGKTRNENISQLYVSRQNTVDGRVEYAAIDMSMQRLRIQMDKMRLQQQNIPTSRSSDNGADYAPPRPAETSAPQEQLDELTSQSLPDDLSMGTDSYAANGGFVSIRRGGYSNDGSFQRRPVSPSLLPDLDGPSLRMPSSTNIVQVSAPELPQSFSQTKSRTPSSNPNPSTPRTPKSHNHERTSSDDRPKSSGSPLKLFDKYDTFTNDRLIRRMSKFEETIHHLKDDEIEDSDGLPSSPSPRRRRPYRDSQIKVPDEAPASRRISSFGDGQLNDYGFSPSRRSGSEPRKSKTLQDAPKTEIFYLQRSASYESEVDGRAQASKDRRRNIRNPSLRGQGDRHGFDPSVGPDNHINKNHGTKDRQEDMRTATGKRLPYSPAKPTASKRRRTLLTLEGTHASLQEHVAGQEPSVQAVSGRKRKDARYDGNSQAADPSILATRQIRRLKVPLISQGNYSTENIRADIASQNTNQPIGESLDFDEKQDSIIDPPTQIVAGALATIALNTAQEVTSGSRKASVTTSDFFNEAQQIMQLIRAKGRPRSSHATTEGSQNEQLTIAEESYAEDITKDEFSRPPSREGKPQRLEEPIRLDARAVSHLRKFKDDQDLGLALSPSLKTLGINQSRKQSQALAVALPKDDESVGGLESDLPNVRIRESTMEDRKRQYSSSANKFSSPESEERNDSQNSHGASEPASGRSNPTGSSHSSTNRRIIAPETVAHLLSDQMAGMVFDREKQLWVKRKSSPIVDGIDHRDCASNDGTDEDLFGDIPDLSVDEMEELQRVKDAVSSIKSMPSLTDKVSVHDKAFFNEQRTETLDKSRREEDARPSTAEDKSIPVVENSSAPSKFSHFSSSGPQPGTRATSWGDDAFPAKRSQVVPTAIQPISNDDVNQQEEQVEHEISIYEGRESHDPRHQGFRKHQARVVTVAFSSPLVEHREPNYDDNDDPDSEEESNLSLADSPVRCGSQRGISVKKPVSTRDLGRRSVSRGMSANHQSFLPRPMSRLDEEEEISLVHCSINQRRVSMEVAITTPMPMSRSLMVPPSTNGRSSVGFHLSPLPDFTVHQIDKPIDGCAEVVKKPASKVANNSLSLAAQDLVKNLTDLEPYEPYWDYVRSVDLHGRDLGTLHMLDEFCGRVEELDVSDNEIRELSGIPNTVRQLKIQGNSLSDLAAWDPLRNLQYLNVSDNRLSSLKGFQTLFHLRSLIADGNEIQNLHGLEDLNGLTSLSLRGNKLKEVDFENFDL